MKKFVIILAFVFVLGSISAQDSEIKSHPKNEIGFSVGVFPVVGYGEYALLLFFEPQQVLKHRYSNETPPGQHDKGHHFGSYTLNYNYHFNSRRSMGISTSWLGWYIDEYRISYNKNDTVDIRGWMNFFTFQVNYRQTYYHNNKISLYWGIHGGVTLCIIDDVILSDENRFYDKYEFFPAIQLNAFGIEFGEKYVFHLELGIGTQGLLKTGFRYKF